MRKALLFIALSAFLSACGGGKKTVEPQIDNRPEWVKQHPVNPAYYTGIGMVPKRFHPNDFAEQAKKNALNNLASEIQVNVSSNSMLFSVENNDGFREEYKDFIQVKTNRSIKNFEQVDVYESDDEFWVYYRLSKEQYQKDRALEIEKAINKSVLLIEQGDGFELKKDHKNALVSYLNAIEPIKPYLGEQLNTSYEGNEVYLGNLLFHKVDDLTKELRLIPTDPKLEIVIGQVIKPQTLKFTLIDEEGNKGANFPIIFDYSNGRPDQRRGLTSNSGVVYGSLNKVLDDDPNQEFRAKIDFATLVNAQKEQDEFTEKLLSSLNANTASIALQVRYPKCTIRLKHNGNINPADQKNLEQSIASYLTKKGFTINSSNVDLLIDLEIVTNGLGKKQDMYFVQLGGVLNVRDAISQEIIYTDHLKDFKGAQLSKERALENAFEKLSTYLNDTGTPRFYRSYMK